MKRIKRKIKRKIRQRPGVILELLALWGVIFFAIWLFFSMHGLMLSSTGWTIYPAALLGGIFGSYKLLFDEKQSEEADLTVKIVD